MTHREIVIRLAEAYIKAGQSIEADKIIKIADYFMAILMTIMAIVLVLVGLQL